MPITRAKKEALLDTLQSELPNASIIVFGTYRGLKVAETESFRKTLRTADARLQITKNTILKRALDHAQFALSEESILDEPLCIVVGHGDAAATAKVIATFQKEHEAFSIKAGVLEGQMVEANIITTLASLPTRDELYAKVLGSLTAPLKGMVNVLSCNLRGLVSVLSQYKTQTETT